MIEAVPDRPITWMVPYPILHNSVRAVSLTGKFKTHFGLEVLNPFENFLQHGLLDARQLLGVDVIVRFAVFFDDGGNLPHEPQLHHEAVSAGNIIVVFGGVRWPLFMQFDRGVSMVLVSAMPFFQGMDAGKVHHRQHGLLDVERIAGALLWIRLQNSGKKAEGRLEMECIFGHVAEKSRTTP